MPRRRARRGRWIVELAAEQCRGAAEPRVPAHEVIVIHHEFLRSEALLIGGLDHLRDPRLADLPTRRLQAFPAAFRMQ